MTLEIITLIVLCIGALGVLLPMLPGVPFMFVATLVYAFVSEFARMEPWHLWIFAGMMLLALVIDWSAGLLGARFGGASKKSMMFGLVGMVIGLFAFPPFGIFIGLFGGIFIGEIMRQRTADQALKSATSSVVASALGIAANFVLALVFIGVFVGVVFF